MEANNQQQNIYNINNMHNFLNIPSLSSTGKRNDINYLYDYYTKYLKGSDLEYEQNLLLLNGLIDPNILISQEYSIFKLKALIEKLDYRLVVVGTENSNAFQFCNCLLKQDLLNDTRNVVLVVKTVFVRKDNIAESDTNKFKLFKCKIEYKSNDNDDNFGIKFVETDLVCEGVNEIKEKVKQIDEEVNLNLFDLEMNSEEEKNLNNLDLDKVFYIIHRHIPFSEYSDKITDHLFFENSEIPIKHEIVIFPSTNSINNINYTDKTSDKILKIFKFLLDKDSSLLHRIETNTEHKIEAKILHNFPFNNSNSEEIPITDSSICGLKMTKDFHFTNLIQNRQFKRNIIINILTPSDLTSQSYKEIIDSTCSSSNCCIDHIIVINNSENKDKSITSDFLKQHESSFSPVEFEEVKHYLTLLKDNKLSTPVKEDIQKKIVEIVIYNHLNNKTNHHHMIVVASSYYALLNRITNLSDEASVKAYHKKLHETIENSIYKTFEEFREKKLKKFLLEKSAKYEEEFRKFEDSLWSGLKLFHINEVNHFLSSYIRYSILMNDELNIPLNSFSYIQIKDSVDLEATIIRYKNIIDKDFESYEDQMIIFYTKFSKDFEDFYTVEMASINSWYNHIYLHTSTKIEELSKKFNYLISELQLRLSNYFNEIIEKDMSLIISIKDNLKRAGYMNEYLSKYLSNIEYSFINIFNKDEYDHVKDKKSNQIFYSIGLSGGLGIASGLITFGVTRVLSVVAADAFSGTVFGPVGTITGTTIGVISLFGTSVYNIMKNKSRMREKYNEFLPIIEDCRNLVYEKMDEFRMVNKKEIEMRIKKIVSYVELSVRKSVRMDGMILN